MAGTYILYQDAVGEWRWRLTAANGRILAVSSEGYKRRHDCVRCIRAVQKSENAEMFTEKDER